MEHFHPADDRLVAVYFGDEAASADDRRAVRQHLHGCETCTWRYTELSAPLERLRQDAASEADEAFSPARLEAQRTRIMERLEGTADSSRVIPFPTTQPRLDRAVMHRPVTRWVAAAAAAGVIVGLMAGRVYEWAPRLAVGHAAPMAQATQPAAIGTPQTVTDSPSVEAREGDELMLSEIDAAVRTQRIAALSALDEMTPHLRPEATLARSLR
jgi:hypothetical protein